MQDYEKAKEIMAKYPGKQFFSGPKPESLIQAAERALELKFPPTYRRFLLEYGAGAFGAFEVYGVIDTDFEQSSIPDAIWATLKKRNRGWLPSNLVVISALGDGDLFCLDLGAKEGSEAPVVIHEAGYREEKHRGEVREVIARDFGEFFLQGVQRQVRRWQT